ADLVTGVQTCALPIFSSRRSRERIANPPTTMIASASAIHGDIGPHQKSSGSARLLPSARKQMTRPMFDGLNRCRPRSLITYLDRSEERRGGKEGGEGG